MFFLSLIKRKQFKICFDRRKKAGEKKRQKRKKATEERLLQGSGVWLPAITGSSLSPFSLFCFAFFLPLFIDIDMIGVLVVYLRGGTLDLLRGELDPAV